MSSLSHDTITLTKKIAAPVAAVWGAYADSSARAKWSVPTGEAMVYDESDFREGGRDSYRCGPVDSLDFHALAEYVRIAPKALVVYSETVKTANQILAAGIVTWEFTEDGPATIVKITGQITSFVGQGMIDGNLNGHTKALNQLAAFLED